MPQPTINYRARASIESRAHAQNYTEGTVADDIHTRFIQEKKGGFGPIGMVVAMVAAVAISIVTAGAGAVLVTAALGSAFAATAVGVAMSVAISGLIAGTLSSMVSQLILTGSLNIGAALKAGVVSGVTAGLTQGALGALNLGNAGVTSIGDNLAKGSWDAVQSNLGNYVQASVVRSAISAGVNTVAYGGSFGQAFANGLVRDAAAVGANAIGVTLPGIGAVGADTGTILANAASHALLGCAAQSLTGGDCAGGAVGGAASALAAPLIRDAVYADSSAAKYSDDLNRLAATVGLASLIGGAAGALLGTNATSAALAAQNESLNNATSGDVKKPGPPDDIRKMLEQERRAFGQRPTVKGPGGAEVVAPSPLVLGGARANSAAGASTIQQNKAVGDAYATQTYRNVVGEMPDAVQEVTVKTASGTRTRLDIIGTNTNGAVTCVECKASATARLTPNQAAAFPEMAETGATVVGKGKPGFPGGTVIPPTTVQIVRPGDTLKKGN